MTTCWKHDLIHLTMSLEFGICSALDEGAIHRRKVQQQTTKKVMTMSKDDWKAECTKVDDLKLTNARGNKIRRTMMPPIFSMGCSRIFQSSAIKERDHSDHRHKAREPPSILTPQAKKEPWRQTIGAMLLAGESMVMTLKPRMHNKTLQRPQDQDHRHLRIDS